MKNSKNCIALCEFEIKNWIELKINPLMPRIGTIVALYSIYNLEFKQQMLQAANTDLFNPLVPKAHSSGRQQIYFISLTY